MMITTQNIICTTQCRLCKKQFSAWVAANSYGCNKINGEHYPTKTCPEFKCIYSRKKNKKMICESKYSCIGYTDVYQLIHGEKYYLNINEMKEIYPNYVEQINKNKNAKLL